MSARNQLSPAAGETGTSLVDVMIALVLLGIMLMGVMQLTPLGSSGITDGRTRTRALHMAQQQMETLRSLDFTAPVLSAGSYSDTTDAYVVSWTVLDDQPVAGGKRVDITTTWDSSSGSQSVSLTSYLTDR